MLSRFYSICRRVFAVAAALLLYGSPAAAMDSSPGRIFLTFDDGPINVTLDILDVLRTLDIRATFFVNAIHLEGRGGENEDRAEEALRRIVAEGHLLGNHSHNHMAHNRPRRTSPIGAAGAYRDVETALRYFVPANITAVNKALGGLATLPNNRIADLSRLPYSNVWMLRRLGEVCDWCSTEGGPLWHPDAVANREREVSEVGGRLAAALYHRHNMESYGWDVHWQPGNWTTITSNETLPAASAVQAEILALLKQGIHCSTSAPTQCKAPVRKHNVIVLVHDFLFENGDRGWGRDVNLPKLVALIASLKKKGYVFSTLDRYLD